MIRSEQQWGFSCDTWLAAGLKSVAEWERRLENDKNKRSDDEAVWSVIQFGFIGIFKLIDLCDWFSESKTAENLPKSETRRKYSFSSPCPCIYRFSRFFHNFFLAQFPIDLLKFYWGIYRFFAGHKLRASIVLCAATTSEMKIHNSQHGSSKRCTSSHLIEANLRAAICENKKSFGTCLRSIRVGKKDWEITTNKFLFNEIFESGSELV